ncbi:aspartyl/Asparaginyl beta-hydroxylase domain-containing protein [Ditylenchus destructor]|nr:aspartyl/Asparaginyl beta-hydroxylase domain-containing protein [Ditylenchus destructor]
MVLYYLWAVVLLVAPWFLFVGLALLTRHTDEPQDSRSKLRQRGLCSSPGCVRCTQNKIEFTKGLERFNRHFGGNPAYLRIKDGLAISSDPDQGDVFFRMNFSTQNPIWPSDELPQKLCQDLATLEASKKLIVEECDKALKCAYLWRRNEEESSFWYTFSLINQGAWQEDQCRECPGLAKALHKLDSLLSDCVFGNAFISMLPRGSVIAEHRGMTNVRLRVHFGVEIPKDLENCFMVVGGQKFHWANGESVVFDDSFPHSVNSKQCKEDRIVLVLDVWNPQLSAKERDCISRIFPAVYL